MTSWLFQNVQVPMWAVVFFIAISALDSITSRYFQRTTRRYFDEVVALAKMAIDELARCKSELESERALSKQGEGS